MRRVKEALRVLQDESRRLMRNAHSKRLDGRFECKNLIRFTDQLKADVEVVRHVVPKLDPALVWRRFEANGWELGSLSALEIRTLCSSSEFSTRGGFVLALRLQPKYLENMRCLYAMVNSYFTRWRPSEEPEELEALLRIAIKKFPKKNKVIDRWREEPSLFSEQAARSLAVFVANNKRIVIDEFRARYIGEETQLARQVRIRIAEIAVDRLRRSNGKSQKAEDFRWLEWMSQEVLTASLPSSSLRDAVSALILSKPSENAERFRDTLRSFVLKNERLGDPRLPQHMPNWQGVDPAAQKRFLSWLARDSIQFFFNTILPKNDKNRRRADFWLNYYEKIIDFQVAVSDQDYHKLVHIRSRGEIPYYSRVDESATSAFLMKFDGGGVEYVIVEFSDVPNAAYIYNVQAFESTGVGLRTEKFNLKRHLKHEGKHRRISHTYNWEETARKVLAELGIRP